ncbi:hypothetical protein [Pseudomonas sp. PDM31]|uniref:hypothetical protein n=1 Tax=Pseudomonas sp. PDM31 TaxID=2854778 RepID=UPI001C464B56|nr:hypothetical protein [Pseudomonas sp. PDM31]MBV7478732.1 hypothetical protein [Pseudomonas sp. PDM31]
MSTQQHKSFLATLNTGNNALAMVSHNGNTPVWTLVENGVADVVYFRYEEGHYTLHAWSKDDHLGPTINLAGVVFTVATTNNPTTFNLMNADGKVVTLDNLTNDKEVIRLQTRDGKELKTEIVWGDAPQRVSTVGQYKLNLELNILERNAP